MSKKAIIAVIGFNLFIAISFFIMNHGVGYSHLASDQHNIVPMCQKLDNPYLFQKDLFLSSVENLITNILYGLSWFLLFYILFEKNFWVAFLLSILIRGLVWLPGMEVWGFSDLWTFMPRTVYSAFLPIPFIILLWNKKYSFVLSALLIGFIFNFHPITGLGGILIYLYCVLFLTKKIDYPYRSSIKNLLLSISCISVGMLPFVLTYFGKTVTASTYNLDLYHEAFDARIPGYFKRMAAFAAKWMTAKMLFFLLPILSMAIVSFFYKKFNQWALFTIGLSFVLFIVPLLSIPIENWFNEMFHVNLRMSFQLVRVQKLAILPGYLTIGCLLIWCVNQQLLSKRIFAGITVVYLAIIILATPSRFKSIPFISDDITTSIFPNESIFTSIEDKQTDFDKMAMFIKKETPADAVFYKEYRLRSAALRSVKFDHKGASILIEGNPEKLIEWYQTKQKLKTLTEAEKKMFLKEQGVTHILSKENFEVYRLLKQIGKLKLYAIN